MAFYGSLSAPSDLKFWLVRTTIIVVSSGALIFTCLANHAAWLAVLVAASAAAIRYQRISGTAEGLEFAWFAWRRVVPADVIEDVTIGKTKFLGATALVVRVRGGAYLEVIGSAEALSRLRDSIRRGRDMGNWSLPFLKRISAPLRSFFLLPTAVVVSYAVIRLALR
jgi:hypothetical protein